MKNDSQGIHDVKKQQTTLDRGLLELLADIREGTDDEKQRLEAVQKHSGEEVYSQAIYLLTRTVPQSADKAKNIFDAIKSHRDQLSTHLKRSVSLNVAALDWVETTGEADLESASAQTMFGRHMVKAIESLGNPRIQDREHLIPALDRELEKGKEESTPLSIVLLDVSHLGDIHTAYGYQTENQIMSAIKERLSQSVHTTDTVFHHGRNRYVVILPGVGKEAIDPLAQRLRNSLLQEIGHTVAGNSLIHSGVATTESESPENSRALIETAEHDLQHDLTEQNMATQSAGKVKGDERRRIVSARPIVEGIAIGKVFLYQDIMTRDFELRDLASHEFDSERQRIQTAINRVKHDIESIEEELSSNLSPEQVAIFGAQKMILDDPYLHYELERQMRDKMINAEHIVRDTFRKMSHQFLHSDNELIRQKSSDIADIERRVMTELTGTGRTNLSDVPPGAIVMTKRLLPSDTITLNTRNVRAFVTEEGSKSSHSAMLARALDLPYVSEVPLHTFRDLPSDCEIIVDGTEGKITIYPTLEEKKNAASIQHRKEVEFQSKLQKGKAHGLEYQGGKIRIAANISIHSEAQSARRSHCDGVGLFRIETLFMMFKSLPTEDSLTEQLSYIIEPLVDEEITIRLLDIGGDKTLPYLNIGEERNPLLGLRGVRLLRRFPGLLRSQLRAFLRLSTTRKLRILIPMTSLADDVKFIRESIEAEKRELSTLNIAYDNTIPVGAMVETPAAVLNLDDIIAQSDFLSIGTNDLVQYSMAADREKMSVTDYYEAGTKLIVEVVGEIVAKAREAGKSCMVCGEMAADTTYTQSLLSAGLREFSVPPSHIPVLREKISEIIG